MQRFKFLLLQKLDGRIGLLILSIAFTRRLRRLLRRPVNVKVVNGFSTNAPLETEADKVVIARLIGFWNSMQGLSTEDKSETSLWTEIQEQQDYFHNLMGEGNCREIYEYLSSAPTQTISRGILQGDTETLMLRINPSYRKLQSKILKNKFVSLLERIGSSQPTQNPEQGLWGINRGYDFKAALCALDAEFGFTVFSPNVYSGLFLTNIGGRNFNQVDIMALNASLEIRRILEKSSKKSVVEIGAGSGMTAYWCNRLGLGPIQLIDLPHVAVLQAFYLLKTLPSAKIYLYGEDPISDADITIFPNWASRELPIQSSELVFNQDSFAEMSYEVVDSYLKWIVEIRPKYLLSINHESEAAYGQRAVAQVNISSLIRQNSMFKTISRNPNWIRTGYIDQIWKIKN